MSYKDLKSFQQATIIYDFAVDFCNNYINKRSRTHDQMVQAARSGKQNIAEGTANSETKPKSEIYLLSIASASLKELLEDYKDFLRQRNLECWDKDDSRAVEVRRLVYMSNKSNRSDKSDRTDRSDRTDKSDTSYETYKSYLKDAGNAANAMICLINQTTYLLDQQIKAVKKQMEARGIRMESHSQRLTRLREENRKKNEEFDKKLREIVEGKRKTLDD